ncbi:uncharacterized protein [Argopecten irradians]|uniref:uncharacterized protein n=1 Tax=Argopecten irradians TaxID=31199 RepID=UPI003713D5E4
MKVNLLFGLGCLIPLTLCLRSIHASCVDSDSHCPTWARNRYCQHSDQVRQRCHLSCGICSSSSGSPNVTLTENPECLLSHEYVHLKNLMGDSCSPMDNQWYFLYFLTSSHHVQCARDAAMHLRDYFKAHQPSPNCTCDCPDTELTHGAYATINHCRESDDNYRAIYDTTFYTSGISSLGRSCRRHADEWEKLAAIETNLCFMDLVKQFHDKFFAHNYDMRCTCRERNELHVRSCSFDSVDAGLIKHEIISEGSQKCSDGLHVLSESVPMKMCNAPAPSAWVKGEQVMSHCNSIPKYSAIAAFPGHAYTHDGLAGVFVSCNATSLTIATEDCTRGMSLFNIPVDGMDSYIHQAHNYYTIIW